MVPSWYQLFVGFVADFFDTLGIGSFATTTSLYRARQTIDDRLLPGTLNVGHALPTIAQALIYIGAIEIEAKTLIAMIAAAVAGALLGAPIVARWPRRQRADRDGARAALPVRDPGEAAIRGSRRR